MSELYRDDIQETTVLADSACFVYGVVAEDVARMADGVRSGIGLSVAEAAQMGDGSADNAAVLVNDVITAKDVVAVDVGALTLTHEKGKVIDTLTWVQVLLAHEQARILDVVLEGKVGTGVERGQLADVGLSAVSLGILVVDAARLRGRGELVSADSGIDSALAEDWALGAVSVRQGVFDAGVLVDSALVAAGVQAVAQESAKAADAVMTWVQAGNVAHDVWALLDSYVSDDKHAALMWTASVDGWGMSRYLSLPFRGLVVINGVVHGWSDDGVFALDGADEFVSSWVTTGKVDVSKGVLAHPVAAYLEYELADGGYAEMAVSSTQSGQSSEYVYSLAAERSNELTNGRFIFGRGLRGRHFGFELRLTGKQAHVNDWVLDVVPTKRKV